MQACLDRLFDLCIKHFLNIIQINFTNYLIISELNINCFFFFFRILIFRRDFVHVICRSPFDDRDLLNSVFLRFSILAFVSLLDGKVSRESHISPLWDGKGGRVVLDPSKLHVSSH